MFAWSHTQTQKFTQSTNNKENLLKGYKNRGSNLKSNIYIFFLDQEQVFLNIKRMKKKKKLFISSN